MSTEKLTNLAKARSAWANATPDWIVVLAEACDRESQAAIAKRLRYSGSAVSQVLSNSYQKGDIVRVELAVRGALMAEEVQCPGMNVSLPRESCIQWQRKPFSTASSNSVRMYHACRSGCPFSHLKEGA